MSNYYRRYFVALIAPVILIALVFLGVLLPYFLLTGDEITINVDSSWLLYTIPITLSLGFFGYCGIISFYFLYRIDEGEGLKVLNEEFQMQGDKGGKSIIEAINEAVLELEKGEGST